MITRKTIIPDLELSDQDPSAGATQSVRKNISLKLKPSPKGKAKTKKITRTSKKPAKKVRVEDEEEDNVSKGMFPRV